MSRRVGSHLWLYHRGLPILIGTSVAYGAWSHRKPLLNDSSSGKQWPRTSQITIQSRQSLQDAHEPTDTNPKTNQGPSNAAKVDDVPLFDADPDSGAWASLSEGVEKVRATLAAVKWSQVGDSITDYLLPDWAQDLPAYFSKLQRELDMAPGSLADEIWEEAQDPLLNPEISRVAQVRISDELCAEEKMFRQRRQKYTTRALAKYLDIPEQDIDPEDVPTIAMCGSGGGLRALVAGTSSYHSAQEAGLYDCITYTAGVSGSCWLQALYYSTLGKQNYTTLLSHLKRRIGTHIAYPPAALGLLTSAPTNKFLLSGVVEKVKGDPEAEFGIVDIYGILLAARLLVPRGELGVESQDLKLSNQQVYLKDGAHPLPIYSSVRHEIPAEETKKSNSSKDQEKPSQEAMEKAKKEAWFQWFESTPYELWSEELGAGIPTWSVGRHFQNGVGSVREHGDCVPELRLPFML
ncbi:MAG: hypothetical protein Q9183_005469, partial [Haloplaca sp. 2 TL-2023]